MDYFNMKQVAVIIILSGFFFHCSAQNKNIKGIIYDDFTNYHIDSVKISSKYQNSSVFSNAKGRFSISLPNRYHDSIVFSHPGYYPYTKRIAAGDAIKLQFIRLIPKTFKLDTICPAAYDENKLVKGLVEDDVHKEPIANAEIRLENNMIVAYSNLEGKFSVGVPNSNNNLIINHPDFKTLVFPLRQLNKRTPYPEIRMTRKIPVKKDTVWQNWNNHLSWTINEMFSGGFGAEYERFLGFRHSLGLHGTYYFHGFAFPIPFSGGSSINYKGIKLSPFYRFYVWRQFQKGGYAEAKLTTGYFDFSRLQYDSREGPYGDYIATNFWSFGLGIAWGWYIRPRKIDHLLFDISVGFQYLSMKVPESIESEYYGTYHVDDTWWYVTGPGSVLEIKVRIGGIF